VLKGDWGYAGFVMSDWGGTHSAIHAANAGLDRQSGSQVDTEPFFSQLGEAVSDGRFSLARLDDMVELILAALHSVGAWGEFRENTPVPKDELQAHAATARRIADRSIVLLRNEDETLSLEPDLNRLVVVGEGVTEGVLCGGGSSTVTPPDAVMTEGFAIAQMKLPKVRHTPAPLDELKRALPNTEVVHLEGTPDEMAAEVSADDTVVVFADVWATEGRDHDDLHLEGDQDELIAAVAKAAGRTVVALETPGPVVMPWLNEVDAVIEAWYGGTGGAPAIADVLTGAVNPSGRLPVTFPADESQLPRLEMTDPESTTWSPGEPLVGENPVVDYDTEAADVGYRWYAREGRDPLFWFGYGLSYTSFAFSDEQLEVRDGVPVLTFTVTNTGDRDGPEVAQVYVQPPEGQFRLAGWASVELEVGGGESVR